MNSNPLKPLPRKIPKEIHPKKMNKINRIKRPLDNITNIQTTLYENSLKNPRIGNKDKKGKKKEKKIETKTPKLIESTIQNNSSIQMVLTPNCTSTISQESPIKQKTTNTDPSLVAEYSEEIYQQFLENEKKYQPSIDYIEETQNMINEKMREILVDWLIETSQEHEFHSETLFLAINLVDRFLSKYSVSKQQFQLLGAACLMIASKYEEIYPPSIDDFVYICMNTYTKNNFVVCETKVCNELHFDFTVITPIHFLRRFLRITEGSDLILMVLSNYLCELQLLDYSLLKYPPSLIAAAAIFAARGILQKNIWDPALLSDCPYSIAQLRTCVFDLLRLFESAKNSESKACFSKYSGTELYNVALLKSPSLENFF